MTQQIRVTKEQIPKVESYKVKPIINKYYNNYNKKEFLNYSKFIFPFQHQNISLSYYYRPGFKTLYGKTKPLLHWEFMLGLFGSNSSPKSEKNLR